MDFPRVMQSIAKPCEFLYELPARADRVNESYATIDKQVLVANENILATLEVPRSARDSIMLRYNYKGQTLECIARHVPLATPACCGQHLVTDMIVKDGDDIIAAYRRSESDIHGWTRGNFELVTNPDTPQAYSHGDVGEEMTRIIQSTFERIYDSIVEQTTAESKRAARKSAQSTKSAPYGEK